MSNRKRKIQVQNINQEKIIMNSANPLFSFIKAENNDKLSEMNGIDLQELLYYVDNYYLELRNRLGFNNFVTFGLELEFENAMRNRIEAKLNETFGRDVWLLKGDNSLYSGAEINSPILRDKIVTWKNLKQVCDIVSKNASIGKNSGGHIHVGTQVLGTKTESWLNFIKLWSVYENIIYRFAYGDMLVARSSMLRFAEPMAEDFWKNYLELSQGNQIVFAEDIIKKVSHSRYQAVNFDNAKQTNKMSRYNTIEFRCPNGTLNPIIWQNNVNLFVNLLQYSSSSSFNDDILQERKQINKDKYLGLDFYNEIYLQQALELADMLFNNNFDKVYFLRQYLKSFEIAKKENDKPKQFTKKSVKKSV